VIKNRKEIDRYLIPLPRTMSEFVYGSLKEAIINNELKANQRINEKELADRFHVSRTPIREAVLRLATEGFVKIDSYRRAIVKEISFEELRDILEVLGALDRLAIVQAINNMTTEDVKKLETLTNKMEKKCNLNSVEKFIELNAEFHNELWKYVSNKFLLEILHFVRDKKERYSYARLYLYKTPGFLEKSMKHHKELMEAVKFKDIEKLKKMIVQHRNLLLESEQNEMDMKEYLKKEFQSSKIEVDKKNSYGVSTS
jgi:DNA-binding GntR family transcriptional regulator